MVTSGRSQHCLALFSLLLLVNAAAAAHMNVATSVKQLGSFDVLTAIQNEVNTMNTHLEELSTAIDGSSGPTPEPSPISPTDEPTSPTDEPTSPTDEPTSPTGSPTSPTGSPTSPPHNSASTNDNKLRRLFISRNSLTLEVADDKCDAYKDINPTLAGAQAALDLVSAEQLSNTTLVKLKDSNTKLETTIGCVKDGQIELNEDDKNAVKETISQTQESGKMASDTIDNIVSPTTPAPEDDSGFKSATIALGVLLALSLVAVAGLVIVSRRRQATV